MMMQAEAKYYTPEAYLALEDKAHDRHEYIDGEIVPLAGRLPNHNQMTLNLSGALIENAGVQTGCLLLESSGKWAIEAAYELTEGEKVCVTQVLQSISTTRLPESIVQYVIRTHESVILSDATREGDFINDPYIQRNQTQSLLCLPLLN